MGGSYPRGVDARDGWGMEETECGVLKALLTGDLRLGDHTLAESFGPIELPEL